MIDDGGISLPGKRGTTIPDLAANKRGFMDTRSIRNKAENNSPLARVRM